MVSGSGVETVMKSLESFGVFKEGKRIDAASTYDMKFVRQAVKDLSCRDPPLLLGHLALQLLGREPHDVLVRWA